jgi:hypothetical protein
VDAMKISIGAIGGITIGALLVTFLTNAAHAANAYPPFSDVNGGAQAFGVANASEFGGIYTINDTATLNSNAVLSINQNGQLACCHGALIEINVSNGENGDNGSPDMIGNPPMPNTDIPNPTAANPVFAAIGNASGRLENGNVIRFSAWYRSDPANPITLEPTVQPIMKMEYWKEALSGTADTNGVQVAPQFGDRIFDQDQQGSAVGITDLPHWIDLNGDGVVLDGSATLANGRITQTVTNEWRLAVVTHTVNSADWVGIGAAAYGANDVTKIESVKAVMFMGDFSNTNLTGDGADGGNLLVDNVLVEVFKNAAAEAAAPISNSNPSPATLEGFLQGDYNGNGTIDSADYVIWRKGGPIQKEGDSLGVVDQLDYTFWRARFGNTSGAGTVAGVAAGVPEPSSCVLALFASLVAMVLMRSHHPSHRA